jgi:heme exporter protein B
MLSICLKRELRLLIRRKSELLNPLFFFLIVTSLFPLGISPEPDLLAQVAPGIIWVCALLSILLSLDVLYREDFDDGSLEQMLLTGASPIAVVFAKAGANWLVTALLLIVISPLIAIMLNLDEGAFWAMTASLLLGTPAMCLIAAIGMCLTIGLRRGGILLALLVLPLYIPILIFGAMSVNAASQGLPYLGHLALLGAALVFTLTIAPWAAAAALKVSISE